MLPKYTCCKVQTPMLRARPPRQNCWTWGMGGEKMYKYEPKVAENLDLIFIQTRITEFHILILPHPFSYTQLPHPRQQPRAACIPFQREMKLSALLALAITAWATKTHACQQPGWPCNPDQVGTTDCQCNSGWLVGFHILMTSMMHGMANSLVGKI